eukprot:30308-Pelagococcus_subviridis.AAC.11
MLRRGASRHRRLVRAQLRVRLPQIAPHARVRHLPVRHREHPARAHARGEPVPVREALHARDVVRRRALRRHRLAHGARGGDGFVSHHRLLHRREILQRREEHVRVLGAADFGYQVRELLRDREEALVLVVVRVREERDELGSRALRPERGRDRREASDAIQPELDVLVLHRADGEGTARQWTFASSDGGVETGGFGGRRRRGRAISARVSARGYFFSRQTLRERARRVAENARRVAGSEARAP